MPIMYFALLAIVGLMIWGSVIIVRRATARAASKVQSVAADPDALLERIIPLLAYVALVSILFKLTVF